MADTVAQLNNLLRCKADYNYAINQQTNWASKQESNASKLAAQQSLEEKWNDAYSTAYDCGHYGDKDVKAKNVTIKASGCTSEYMFSAFAYAKVTGYNVDALEEYSALDTDYDLKVATYDTLVTELGAMIESYEESVATSAQDTGLLGG